jgi:hypothetical protein
MPGVTANGPAEISRSELVRFLVSGGDDRIGLDQSGRNRYGCSILPDGAALAFSSSTASTISAGGMAAASERLNALLKEPCQRDAYSNGAMQVRQRLAALCGLPAICAGDIILGSSGTELHLFAVDLARGEGPRRLVSILAEPQETGGGVVNALSARRFDEASPYGTRAVIGDCVGTPSDSTCIHVPARLPAGGLRDEEAVDADFEAAVLKAVMAGAAVLVVLLDVSKTGLLSPSVNCVRRLKQRFGSVLTVLVDACQFRLSPESLSRYLAEDFLVAVTGSKFLGGPSFCGALIVPHHTRDRYCRAPLNPALGDFTARADWPLHFASRAVLPQAHNFGLLLRWEAALFELEAFRQLPEADLRRALDRIGKVADARLALPPFEGLARRQLRRFDQDRWDGEATVFPFLLRGAAGPFRATETQRLYRSLREGDGEGPCSRRILLGQPVSISRCAGADVSVLRLGISAAQLAKAASDSSGTDELCGQINEALDAVAARAASFS